MSTEPPHPPEQALAFLAKSVDRSLESVCLSGPQYRMLAYLSRGDEAASQLAEKLQVRPPSVTALVDGLEARALVERSPDPHDRRRTRLLLTKTGRKALADGDTAIRSHLHELADHLPPDRAERALESLGDWQVALRAARTARRNRT